MRRFAPESPKRGFGAHCQQKAASILKNWQWRETQEGRAQLVPWSIYGIRHWAAHEPRRQGKHVLENCRIKLRILCASRANWGPAWPRRRNQWKLTCLAKWDSPDESREEPEYQPSHGWEQGQFRRLRPSKFPEASSSRAPAGHAVKTSTASGQNRDAADWQPKSTKCSAIWERSEIKARQAGKLAVRSGSEQPVWFSRVGQKEPRERTIIE